ncbi:MAG: AAA family ATPase, partial [Microcystaceae cyanobacterium]
MKVKRLELKGFRGFDEIVLDFDVTPGRPTVFIGNNGVGKSSILDALAILLSWFIKRVEFDPDIPEHIVINDDNTIVPRHELLKGLNLGDIKNNYNKVNGQIFVNYQSEEFFWNISNKR